MTARVGADRRVLLWSDTYAPQINGVAVFLARFVPALLEHGFRVGIVTNGNDLNTAGVVEQPGLTLWRLPLLPALAERRLDVIAACLRDVRRLKASFAPHLIHLHAMSASLFFHLQSGPDGSGWCPPTLFTLHQPTSDRTNACDSVMGQTLCAARAVTANSAAVLRHAAGLVPEIRTRSRVIHYGLEVSSQVPAALSFQQPVLLFVGRLVEDKGVDVAIDAMITIRTRFPRARLVIAGDGPARAALEARTRALRLTDVVAFRGWVAPEDVLSLMNTATIVLMPSRWEEAFGLVALESAAAGRPVIATTVCGIPEVVADGLTGLLVPKNDPSSLAAAISYLLDNPNVAAEMGRAGRLRVEREFNWSRCVSQYLEIYDQLCPAANYRQTPVDRSVA